MAAMRDSGIRILGEIPPGTVVAVLYESERDWADICSHYLSAGIAAGEACLYVSASDSLPPPVNPPAHPVNPHPELKGGIACDILSLTPDRSDLDWKASAWIERTCNRGQRAARIAVNMARPGLSEEQAADIERALRPLIEQSALLGLFGYSAHPGSPHRLLHLLRTHHSVLVGADGQWELIGHLSQRSSPAEGQGDDFYRTLIEGAHDMVVVLDPEGHIRYASPSLERIGGYEIGEILGKNAFDFVHPDDLPAALALFNHGVQIPGYETSTQVRLLRKNGAWRWVELRGRNLLDDPAIRGAVLNFVDIHDIKTALEALEQSEARFRTIFENANDQIVFLDETGTIINANGKLREMFGLKLEEIIGKRFTEIAFADPEEKQRVMEGFGRMLRGEASVIRAAIEGRHRNGQRVFIEANARAIPIDGGKKGIIAIIRDITRQKLAQEALEASEEKWRSLAESAPDIVMTTTCEGQILYVNRTVTGFTPVDIIGKSIYDFVKPEHHATVRTAVETAVRTGDPVAYEIVGAGPEGHHAWYETHIGPIKRNGQVTALIFINTDITARKRAEEAIRESEQKFRGIFENASDMILYLDSSGIILDVNDRSEEIFGYRREELLGKRFITFPTLRPEVMWDIIDRFNRVMHSNTSDTISFEALRKDGSKVFVEATARPVHIGREAAGLLAAVRDITERKLAELALKQAYDEMEARVEERTAQLARSNAELEAEIAERKKVEVALRLSEAKYRLVAENTSDFIAVTTPDGIYMYASPSHRRLGYDPEKLIGTSGMDLVHPDDRDPLASTVREHLRRWRTEKAQTPHPMLTVNLEYRVRDTAGNWHILETTSNYVARPNAKPIMVHVSRDITERKQAAEALRESEEKFKTIFENASDEIIYLDEHGRVVDRNIKGPDVVGLTFEEVKGKGLDELAFVLPPHRFPALVKMFQDVLDSGVRGSTQVEMIHKDGHTVFVEASASSIRKGDRLAGVVIILRDITERKRAEESLRRYAAELQEANEELSQYAQVASHDICAPLRAIRYYTHLLRRELGETAVTDPKGYLNTIDRAVIEGEELAEHLLELAKIGQAGLHIKRFNIGTMLRKMIAAMGLPADVEISLKSRWPTVESDPTLLRQIFRNLLDNAVKFNHSSPKRVELGWRAKNDGYEFYVKDNGIGIAFKDQERIFNVFERLHHREEYKGTGVGLAIVKKASSKLGGTVRVESSPGSGSTFFVTIPKPQESLR